MSGCGIYWTNAYVLVICGLYICMCILVSLVDLSLYVEDWFEGDAHAKTFFNIIDSIRV